MLVPDREYVAADGTADIDRAVQKALARASGRPGKHAAFAAERASTVRRTWLDTFDWRLHRAGFVLQRVERSRTPPTLRLSLATGDDVLTVTAPPSAQTATRVAYPLDAVVPAGPMRSLLEPVVEMRALQPVATQRLVVRSYRVLNDDEKTVARVIIERPTSGGAGRCRRCRLASEHRGVTRILRRGSSHCSDHRESARPHGVSSVNACASTGRDRSKRG